LKHHLWIDSLVKEIVSTDEFVSEINHIILSGGGSSEIETDDGSTEEPTTSMSKSPNASSLVNKSPSICTATPTRESTERKRSRIVGLISPSKRFKHIHDSIDEEIEKHKKGMPNSMHVLYITIIKLSITFSKSS